ncbi:Transmembrane and TPR repeat-containing protein 1 [Eufriesea mexicana]|uniref:Transmembrane and TPR repeat-containing protein 1 n=1 Tax=Eufriesea mexicana TaxID=516756 RepID=A0A310SRU3_9HYME|nr:Transmembrane and TPR repeat-containing protein 1 [Eufriesea mexicana]
MGSRICYTTSRPFLFVAALSLPLSVLLSSFVVALTLRSAATINSVYRKLRQDILQEPNYVELPSRKFSHGANIGIKIHEVHGKPHHINLIFNVEWLHEKFTKLGKGLGRKELLILGYLKRDLGGSGITDVEKNGTRQYEEELIKSAKPFKNNLILGQLGCDRSNVLSITVVRRQYSKIENTQIDNTSIKDTKIEDIYPSRDDHYFHGTSESTINNRHSETKLSPALDSSNELHNTNEKGTQNEEEGETYRRSHVTSKLGSGRKWLRELDKSWRANCVLKYSVLFDTFCKPNDHAYPHARYSLLCEREQWLSCLGFERGELEKFISRIDFCDEGSIGRMIRRNCLSLNVALLWEYVVWNFEVPQCKLWPTYASAHNNLGTLTVGDQAEQHFLAAIHAQPSHVNAHYNLGQLYRKTNRTKECIRMLQKCVSLDPAYAPAYVVLARLATGPTAGVLLRHVVRLQPRSPDHLAEYASWLYQNGKWLPSLKYYLKAMEVSPSHRSSLLGTVRILRSRGQWPRVHQLITRGKLAQVNENSEERLFGSGEKCQGYDGHLPVRKRIVGTA